MKCIMLMISSLLIFLSINLNAQDKAVVVLDLADELTSLKLPSKPGSVEVKIKNYAPGNFDNYRVQIEYEQTDVPKLEIPSKLGNAIKGLEEKAKVLAPAAPVVGAVDPACATLDASIESLKTTRSEKDVPKNIVSLQVALKAATDKGCDNRIKVANELISLTEKTYDVTVETGVKMKLVVIKVDPDSLNKPTVIKNLSISSNAETKWITTYGLGFSEDKNNSYYSMKNPAEGATDYLVKETANRNDRVYSAQILFTYPFNKFASDFSLGVTGGLGASEENISALIGFSLVVNKNIVLTYGVSMQEQSILNGQFEVGQSIGNTALDSSVLTDTTYKSTQIIVLSFRF